MKMTHKIKTTSKTMLHQNEYYPKNEGRKFQQLRRPKRRGNSRLMHLSVKLSFIWASFYI